MNILQISFHTSPFGSIGKFDSGGLNVYVQQISKQLSNDNNVTVVTAERAENFKADNLDFHSLNLFELNQNDFLSDLDFSFSGLKTGFMNFVKNGKENNPRFVEENLHDICASIQHTIIEILLDKLLLAAKQNNIDVIAIAGGVSANNGLRAALEQLAEDEKWEVHVPKFEYCTDNAAMIGIAGYYKYAEEQFTDLSVIPQPRYAVDS